MILIKSGWMADFLNVMGTSTTILMSITMVTKMGSIEIKVITIGSKATE